MKILITCPRAPVTIEWIRIFEKNNYEVILVDSLKFPLAKYYKKTKYIQIASPRLDFELYSKEMEELINEVDLVIPNCEDIFYLTKVRNNISSDTVFFMPENDLLFMLHHKYSFFNLLNNYVKFPKTKLIEDKRDIKINKDKILKPVFSRFGRNVILNISKKNIENIHVSSEYPWVEQDRIVGKSICNYALADNGKILAHVAYLPKYLLNGAAATYFEPYFDERLEKFIKQFVKDNNYTGQVAFDFIDDGVDIYVLECNPRATSGLHLLSEGLKFENKTFLYEKPIIENKYRVGKSLYLIFGLNALINGKFKILQQDYKEATDVLKGIPFNGQFLYLWGMICRSIKYRKDITSASTFDLEFDG